MHRVEEAKRKYHRKQLGVESGPVPLRNWTPPRQSASGTGHPPMGAARQRIAIRKMSIEQPKNAPRD